MKQIVQNLKTGKVTVVELPVPKVKEGHLLIRTSRSLISLGSERMLVEFGKAGWINKARQQPDKVRQAVEKISTDGLGPTLNSIANKLDLPQLLGYSNVGVVLDVGKGVTGYVPGDRVLSNGRHAEIVCVPEHLCAKVPDSVDDETAAFGVVSSIALQAVRLADPTLGESFAVLGLGLVGILVVQVLLANGCQVFGFDLDPQKVALAKEYGADAYVLGGNTDPVAVAHELTNGAGVDGVLICASTKANYPIQQAPQMCRKRGRVILVGVVGLALSRADFYQKEVTFQVSCAYGPGRYDDRYEDKGMDYPIGFVRWTEQRNFQAVLQLMSRGLLSTEKLITSRITIERAPDLYDGLEKEGGLGFLIEYPGNVDLQMRSVILDKPPIPRPANCVIGFIGAGSFAGGTLIPAFKQTGARLKAIATSSGISGDHQGRKYGFEMATTDYTTLLTDPEINTVVITTRHNSHARFVLETLRAGKHVFVEKPLCLTMEELSQITDLYSSLLKNEDTKPDHNGNPLIMIGFNKRFSPLLAKAKNLLEGQKGTLAVVMTVNAGALPSDHWTQDPEVGGGRLIGEACHYVDLFRYLSEAEITESTVVYSGGETRDTLSIQLSSKDGSIGAIHYFSNGNKGFAKDTLDIFCGGKVLHMDNFKTLRGFGWKGFRKMNLWRQDKGHVAEVKAFVRAIEESGIAPISFEEIVDVTETTLRLAGK